MKQLILSLVALSSAANIPQLPVKASYCSSASSGYPTDPSTTTPRSTTTPWYTTPTSRPSPPTTAASSTPDPSCPLGWVDDGNLGCFLFAPQMAGLSWIEALEFCEEQVRLASKLVNYQFLAFYLQIRSHLETKVCWNLYSTIIKSFYCTLAILRYESSTLTLYKELSSSIFQSQSVCQACVTPFQISTLCNI